MPFPVAGASKNPPLLLLLALVIGSAAAQSTPMTDYEISSSTYLGDHSDLEEVIGLAFLSNGNLVVAANVGVQTPSLAGAPVFNSVGPNASGVVLVLSPGGSQVLFRARVASRLFDLAVDPQDRVHLAAGLDGYICMDAELSTVIYTMPTAQANSFAFRVDVGRTTGLVAVLESRVHSDVATASLDSTPGQGNVTLLLDGVLVSRFTSSPGSDRNANDVAVDDVNQRIIVVGWKQANDGPVGGPVQIGWMRGTDYAGETIYRLYDWHTNRNLADGRYLNEMAVQERIVYAPDNITTIYKANVLSANNMADTRISRCAIGEDGSVVVVGNTAGGNHMFRNSPLNITESVGARLSNYDSFTSLAGSRAQHMAWIARFIPSAAALTLAGSQMSVTRLDAINPNTMWCQGGGIAADTNGRTFIGGQSAYGLPMWPNEIWKPARNETAFNPFGFNDYIGGAFFQALHWNGSFFTRRDYTTRLTVSGLTRAVAVRTINGVPRIAFAGYTDNTKGPLYISKPDNAVQVEPGYGDRDGFLVVFNRAAATTGRTTDKTNNAEAQTLGGVQRTSDNASTSATLRGQLPVRVDGLELDGDNTTVDARLFYPFLLATAPNASLTPRAGREGNTNFQYTGPQFYGGLVYDFGGVNDTLARQTRLGFSLMESVPVRIKFGDNRNGKRLRIRGLFLLYVSDLYPDASARDSFALSPRSTLLATFERLYYRDLDGNTLASKRTRFLIMQEDVMFISEFEGVWPDGVTLQFIDIVMSFSAGVGRWAMWRNISSDIAFDASTAVFGSVTFSNIQAVGFYVADSDWWELPWTKPIPGTDPPRFVAPDRQPTSLPRQWVQLTNVYCSLAKNEQSNLPPTARIAINTASLSDTRTLIHASTVSGGVALDASDSFDPDDGVAKPFLIWNFGDGDRTSGPLHSKTYGAAGLYTVEVTAYDIDRAVSRARRLIQVVRVTNTAEEARRIVASFYGQSVPGNRNLLYSTTEHRRAGVDLDGTGLMNDVIDLVPYADISRPLTGAVTGWMGTHLFGGYRFEAMNTTANTSLMDPPSVELAFNNNPALTPLWIDRNGVRLSAVRLKLRSSGYGVGRFFAMYALDKTGFSNGGNLHRVYFDANSVLRCGPMMETTLAERVRFVVRQGLVWYISQLAWRSPSVFQFNTGTLGIGGNPLPNMTDPNAQLWMPWDPAATQLITPEPSAPGYTTVTFTDVTAFGMVVELRNWTAASQMPRYWSTTGLEMQAAVDMTDSITVAAVAALPADGAAPLAVVFDAGSSATTGFILSYLWDFSDGTLEETTTATTTHYYLLPGIYNASVTASDSFGRQSTAYVTVVVRDAVNSSDTGDAACIHSLEPVGQPVSLQQEPSGIVSTFAFNISRISRTARGTVSVRWRVIAESMGTGAQVLRGSSGLATWGHGDSEDKLVAVDVLVPSGILTVVLEDPYGGMVISCGVSSVSIDECTIGTDNCDSAAACAETAGSFTCTCNAGYTGTGVACSSVDECASGADNCDANASCEDIEGSFLCGCNAGWTGSGEVCDDVNECLTNGGGCPANSQCGNTVGSFTCTCNSGFVPDGSACVDVDECVLGACPNRACTNTPGSFSCGACNSGYELSAANDACVDIDECASQQGCLNRDCTNIAGSFECGACFQGFAVSTATSCDDINECDTANGGCAAAASCSNSQGSRSCSCNQGYAGDGVTCDDIDECSTGNGGGCVNRPCVNSAGSFSCGPCNQGYQLDGQDNCVLIDLCQTNNGGCAINTSTCSMNSTGAVACQCNAGFSGNGLSCSDINECTTKTHNCGTRACTNRVGSFTCACPTFYTWSIAAAACVNIDECASKTHNCVVANTAQCVDATPGFSCSCKPGFSGTTCSSNINECTAGTDNCARNASGARVATCRDNTGSFTCSCNAGYTGNGVDCTNIDECASSPCLFGGTCIDGINRFSCRCAPGRSGTTCLTDINECTANIDNCARLASGVRVAACLNNGGSFTCKCNNGYIGDGLECTELNECLSSPCVNNGTCVDGINRFTCQCQPGWGGTTCSSNVNECTANLDTCARNSSGSRIAACIDTTGSFTCRCNTGFTGNGTTCDAIGTSGASSDTLGDGKGTSTSSSAVPAIVAVVASVALVVVIMRRRRNMPVVPAEPGNAQQEQLSAPRRKSNALFEGDSYALELELPGMNDKKINPIFVGLDYEDDEPEEAE